MNLSFRFNIGDQMKKQQKTTTIFLVALCTILVILTAGCTYNNPSQQDKPQVTPTASITAETTQSTESETTQPTVSWKDFYPDHTEQEKSELIEKSKDEIMRVFPDVDRSTLNGVWVEQARTNDAGNQMIGRPYIDFENTELTSDSETVDIQVDPESLEVIFYSPDTGHYSSSPPQMSMTEARNKAIEFIKNVQGEDSIAYNPDVYIFTRNRYETQGIPVAIINLYKSHDGVTSTADDILVHYDMVKDQVAYYSDHSVNPDLLAGLTTLSAEPDVTLEEAKQIFENKMAEKYDLDELEIEYADVIPYDSYLLWWNDERVVYSDDPDPIRLIWYVGYTDKTLREGESFVEGLTAPMIFRIDAHTGEILTLVYDRFDIRTVYTRS